MRDNSNDPFVCVLTVRVGPKLFTAETLAEWIAAEPRLSHLGVALVAIDQAGRIVTSATDLLLEHSFPVSVYFTRPAPAA